MSGGSIRLIPFIILILETDIIKGDTKNNKSALEALVHKHGGDFTQAQLSDNTALVITPDEKGMSHVK